ncbi:hypothetical protein ACFX1S_009282 [Malus domestica]
MPPVPKSVPGHSLGARSGSYLERLAIMESGKVDSAAKVAPRPIPFVAETDSPARKEDTARLCSCEKSTKSISGEVVEIYVLLKLDLLKVMDVYANKAVKEVAKIMVAEAYLSAEEIKRLDYELVALKGVDKLQRIRVNLLEKNEQLNGEKNGLEASGNVVGDVSAQAGAAGGEAPDDAVAKSVMASEGVVIE